MTHPFHIPYHFIFVTRQTKHHTQRGNCSYRVSVWCLCMITLLSAYLTFKNIKSFFHQNLHPTPFKLMIFFSNFFDFKEKRGFRFQENWTRSIFSACWVHSVTRFLFYGLIIFRSIPLQGAPSTCQLPVCCRLDTPGTVPIIYLFLYDVRDARGTLIVYLLEWDSGHVSTKEKDVASFRWQIPFLESIVRK